MRNFCSFAVSYAAPPKVALSIRAMFSSCLLSLPTLLYRQLVGTQPSKVPLEEQCDSKVMNYRIMVLASLERYVRSTDGKTMFLLTSHTDEIPVDFCKHISHPTEALCELPSMSIYSVSWSATSFNNT